MNINLDPVHCDNIFSAKRVPFPPTLCPPQLLISVTNQTDKGGHHGRTPKQIRIWNFFVIYSFQRGGWNVLFFLFGGLC